METKICKECGEERPISDFKLTRWGTRTDVCRKCSAAKYRETKANKAQIGGGVNCRPFPIPTSTDVSHAKL